MKNVLCCVIFGALCGCCLYVYQRIISALIKGTVPLKAPAWHFWCKNREGC